MFASKGSVAGVAEDAKTIKASIVMDLCKSLVFYFKSMVHVM